MRNEIVKVGIICPCKIEYDQCKKRLKLSQENILKGRLVSSVQRENIEVIAIFAGPGKIQCSSATQLIIDKFNTNFIIDVGASGSLSNELKINEIICVLNSFEYDVADEDFENISNELETKTVISRDIEAKEIIYDFLKKINHVIKLGNIASGEKNVDNKKLRKKLNKELNAIGANWETSAVLKIAELNKVKSFSFRVITDNADENMKDNLHTNWEKGLNTLFKVLSEFIFDRWILKL